MPRFDYTPQEIAGLAAKAKTVFDTSLDKLLKIPDSERTFENTALAFERALEAYGELTEIPVFLAYVSPDAAVREASAALEMEASKLGVEISTRKDIFDAISAYAKTGPKLPADKQRLLDKILRDFRRSGLDLPPDKLAKAKELKKRLVELQLNFETNLRKCSDTIELAREQLAGMDEDYISRLKRNGEKYIVTMDYPDVVPLLENCDCDESKKMLEAKFSNRCAAENVPLMEEALRLRAELANLLGFKTHAEYVLDDRMAKKPEIVLSFLSRLEKKLPAKAKTEYAERMAIKKELTGKTDRLHAWERAYLGNQIKKRKAKLDHELVKQYFPIETVLAGMIDVFEKVFDVEFKKSPEQAWHPDVRVYALHERSGGELIGHFYMDLFPREGKYKHAACFGLVRGFEKDDGSYQKPSAAIVANFSKPGADSPSLLKHGEVETLFHEFGHVTHSIFTKARYGRFSGTSVSWDYVEVPSNMLQNWVWNPQVLKMISGHYKNPDEKLPDELIAKLRADKTAASGLGYLRQVFFSLLDMKYHTEPQPDTTATYASLAERVSLIPMTEGTHPQASFGHLMGGYDAGYYGYLWAEVMATDMFSQFTKNGILDTATGKRYRDCVLAKGSSCDELEQVRAFLGRDPQEDAFVKELGL
jgi:thimet oligopeptidase